MSRTSHVFFRVCSAIQSVGLLGIMFVSAGAMASPACGWVKKVILMPWIVWVGVLAYFSVYDTLFGPEWGKDKDTEP